MQPGTTIAIAVRDDLAARQRLHVVAFLRSGVAARHPGLMGAPYEDASGQRYHALLGLPVVRLQGPASPLQKAHGRALARGLSLGVYSAGMVATGNDQDNRAVVKALPPDGLDLVGPAAFGPRNDVDRALKGLTLHP